MSDEQKPITEILNANPPEAEAAPTADVPAAQNNESNPEPQGDWTYKAVKAEREKRQSLERRVLELEAERTNWLQQRQQTEQDQFWNDPAAEISRIRTTAQDAINRASEAAATVKYGKEALDQMNAAIDDAIKRGDPDMAILREACLQSGDPASVAMDWFMSTRQRGKAAGVSSFTQPAFPSNLATERNAAPRSGPAWGGPTSLTDIFNREAR